MNKHVKSHYAGLVAKGMNRICFHSRISLKTTCEIRMIMAKSAQMVLTGYDRSKIDESVKIIKKYLKTINVKIVEDSNEIKAKSKLWGCEKKDTRQEILFLNGTMNNLKKIIHVKTKDGIYLQLLLK